MTGAVVVNELLAVFVPGRPKTKGSMVARPNGSMHEGVVGSSKWRQMIAELARLAPVETELGPVAVTTIFYLPVASVIAVRAGDIDKLVRNVLDALQDAAVYKDDVQVVRLTSEKHPASDLFAPGVWIRVTRVEAQCAT